MGRLIQIGVECSAEALVGSDENHQITTVTARVKQRMVKILVRSRSQFPHYVQHFIGKRSRSYYSILCAFELRSRYHFHGFSYLLRIFYRPYATANV
jgi:hypothetical protein